MVGQVCATEEVLVTIDRNTSGNRLAPAGGQARMSGRQVAAARALAGIGPDDFAAACGLPVGALTRLEAGGSAIVRARDDVQALARGLDHFGILLVEESGDLGAGVRLKFTRQDVRQLAQLENEGGMIASDDAP